MMRRRVVFPVLALLSLGVAAGSAAAQTSSVSVTGLDGQQRFNAEQIDNLTGPVALYPDALLAQVLVAATFPDQIEDAASWVRAHGTDGIDDQPWDISVKAVAHYPSALNAMADKIDWTAALGKAYASQSSDVMASVQRLRAMAAAQGNLNTTAQQQVIVDNNNYEIAPAQPRVIYVPVYDPFIVYRQPIFNVSFSTRYWSFGVGFPIGSWLSYDCDWGLQRVYYNGWSPSYYAFAGGWRARARPYVRITDIYVSPRYRNVYVNRTIITHVVNYRNVDRYASVHRGSHFEGRPDGRYDGRNDGRGDGRNDGRDGRVSRAGQDNGTRAEPRNGGRSGAIDGRSQGRPGVGDNNGNSGVRTGNGDVGTDNRSARPRGGNDAGSYRDQGDNRSANPPRGAAGRNGPPERRNSEPGTRTENVPQIVVPERGGDTPARASGDPQGNRPGRDGDAGGRSRGRVEMPAQQQPQQMQRPDAPRPDVQARPQPSARPAPERPRGGDARTAAPRRGDAQGAARTGPPR